MTITTPHATRNALNAAVETLASKPLGAYLSLVLEWIPHPIRDDADYDAAVKVIYRLSGLAEGGQPLNEGEQMYLDTVSALIAAYDERVHPMPDDAQPLPERLRGLLDVTYANQSELAMIAGVSRGNVSDVLSGRRGFSKTSIKRLASHFRVDAAYFIE